MSLRSSSSLSLALAMLLAGAAGCGKSNSSSKAGASAATAPGSGSAPTGPADPRSTAIIAASKGLRDRACACTEPMCAATVRKDHDVWLRGEIDEVAKRGEPKSTPAEVAQAAGYQRELFTCLDKYGAATTPPAPMPRPPSAPTPPAPAPATP